ncbi:MAG TPA: hypothetical protein VLF71_02780 [Candidatus Saccharimonadales bacterium]|nr:hypothetical protein [Candidatus Saccharimonadales bacterium]
MEKLVRRLRRDNPGLVFTVGAAHCWSPKRQEIFYTPGEEMAHLAGLLHEVGHARLGHQLFTSDVDLLQKEVDAWEEALRLGRQYDIEISQSHVQDCLDSYRDWLFQRSRCPRCQASGIQMAPQRYQCVNCGTAWGVGNSQQRRPYRLQAIKK